MRDHPASELTSDKLATRSHFSAACNEEPIQQSLNFPLGFEQLLQQLTAGPDKFFCFPRVAADGRFDILASCLSWATFA
jgi:hypothetical protein